MRRSATTSPRTTRRAVSFVRELRKRCGQVARYPRRYPLREEFGDGVRVAVHGSYLILFAQRSGAVVIERVVHGARDLRGLTD